MPRADGKHSFKAGSARYVLDYTPNAFCDLEDETGVDTLTFINRFAQAKGATMSFRDVRLLFWAGLIEEHPDITIREAGDIMRKLGAVDAALELAMKALAQAFPEVEDDAAGN